MSGMYRGKRLTKGNPDGIGGRSHDELQARRTRFIDVLTGAMSGSRPRRAALALANALALMAAPTMLLLSPAQDAHAARLVRVSPEGEVSRVRQVALRFDEAMVPLGDLQAAAPATVSCTGGGGEGQARWVDTSNWVFDFARDLPPGVRCTVRMAAGLRSQAGTAYAGKPEFGFQTGGPVIVSSRPSGGEIEEDQIFALRFNGATTAASLAEHAWCQVQGLGERIPVRLVTGRDREAVLDAIQWKSLKVPADSIHLLACQQTLPAAARMQLVLGPGIATPSGMATKPGDLRRFDFVVREPFTASFSCERENAQAPCTPLRPFSISFSSPVSRKQAEHVLLRGPSGPVSPRLDEDGTSQATDAPVSRLVFAPPFAEKAAYTLEVPSTLKDETGRALANADLFPLKVATAAMPPLAKFPAAPFGVIERFGELPRGKAAADYPPLLPVTLRNVEAGLAVRDLRVEADKAASAGSVSRLKIDEDGAVLRWLALVRRMHESSWTRAELDAILAGRSPWSARNPRNALSIESRSVSLLERTQGTSKLALPRLGSGEGAADKPRPFEVVGIPIADPGFHVVEIESPMLGAALLGKRAPMYVRTAVLVTNLGVHFKSGRDNALAWVTSLDDGKPIANAAVAVRDCGGKLLAQGSTDAAGVARFQRLGTDGESGQGRACEDTGLSGYFVSARIPATHPQARGRADMAFVMSDWNRGIETWRFNVPTDTSPSPTVRVHTVFDRTLLRAGETVSMKHLIRTETATGFGLPAAGEAAPDRVVLRHEGSDQSFTLPMEWRTTATGGRSAESTFALPPAAKLGRYTVTLEDGKQHAWSSGAFRVEAFRLPVLAGTLSAGAGKPLIAPAEVPVAVEVHFVSGGPAVGLPVRLSALLRDKSVRFQDFDDYSFQPPRAKGEDGRVDDEPGDTEADTDSAAGGGGAQGQKLLADKLPLALDKQGGGKLTLKDVGALRELAAPKELLLEAGFSDPNGEIQTLRQTMPVWPAGVIAGIRTESWVSVKQKMVVHGVALDTAGKPQVGMPMTVRAVAHRTTSARKRVVGGFYRYDNRSETDDLGQVCEGKSDAQGRLRCEVALSQPGQVELVLQAKDRDGRASQAAASVWVTRQGELWFGGGNHDRIDVLPEKKSYAPGETAVFQVRMPFRHATALLTIEREGVLESRVVQLDGKDPTVRLAVKPEWGPNVYVSVLALRGRLREVPWYSFFTWGWRQPGEWWRAWRGDGQAYVAPSQLVDLSRPAFRLGLAEIRVDNAASRLDVKVESDKPTYPVRGQASVTVQVRLPDGKPAANGEVALAAVDEALLELMPNGSWELLDAMLQRRSLGVETATAQMEIIGRRHYGRKAVPAGGGGGKSPTRELFDTLLLWNPRVQLDAQGKATLTVPLNDSLTRFRIVAVADHGVGRFGTGSATIAATQDLQLISGLPPLVREDDRYRAMFTVRNTTQRAMTVTANARGTMLAGVSSAPGSSASAPGAAPAVVPSAGAPVATLAPQRVAIPAGEAREIGWDVVAPAALAFTQAGLIQWEVDVAESGVAVPARDRLKVTQRIVPAVPVTVQQATLGQVAPSLTMPVRMPPTALADPMGRPRGGLRVDFQSSLAGGMPGVRDWFQAYPFTCLEQRASRAVGLGDAQAWSALVSQLPSYLDDNGLAAFFPVQGGGDATQGGSEVLTAYLLALADDATVAGLPFRWPDEARQRMEAGLVAFVEGRIQRNRWAPTQDLEVRKLAALEALSRGGHAQARMLDTIQIQPAQWPTSALIDWLSLLSRLRDIPQHEARIEQAQQLLRARLDVQGTRLAFSTEQQDAWWWLMAGGDVNAARLLALAMRLPTWKDDVPRLAVGLIGRQSRGAWSTTNANALGMLAIQRFSQLFEAGPVSGTSRVTLDGAGGVGGGVGDGARDALDWSRAQVPVGTAGAQGNVRKGSLTLPWPAASQAPSATLRVEHDGTGKPWATVQALAAVPLAQPLAAGYRIRRTVTPVEQAVSGKWTRGDIYRVRLEIDAQADMTWVVISDPVPAGATILGSGLGRDSQIATRGEARGSARAGAWPAFTERTQEAYREYYEHLRKGSVSAEYTVRLNNTGEFALPPTRVEAMYAPDVFGALPNARLTVEARP